MYELRHAGALVLQTIAREIEDDLSQIDFDKHREHIARHLPGGSAVGSKFTAVQSVGHVIDLVIIALPVIFQMVRAGLHVETMCDAKVSYVKIAIEFEDEIGTAAVVHRSTLPEHVVIGAVLRGPSPEDQHAVFVARSVAPQLTRRLIIDLRRGTNGRWYLHSAYPGILTPDFTDRAFWAEHVFLEG